MILFVSPHLDDIALSCGGRVAQQVATGELVTIATVCTADSPDGQPLSEPAQHEHRQWRLGDRPYVARRAEDASACATLGARAAHLNLLDAIYRRDDAGQPLYTRNFIGGDVHPDDWRAFYPAVQAALRPLAEQAHTVYAPLAIGGHVDHVIVRRAVESLVALGHLHYYEDFPYAEKAQEIETLPVVAELTPDRIALTPGQVDARIRAIAFYSSQLPILFGAAAAMPKRVRNYVARCGGERYWQR